MIFIALKKVSHIHPRIKRKKKIAHLGSKTQCMTTNANDAPQVLRKTVAKTIVGSSTS